MKNPIDPALDRFRPVAMLKSDHFSSVTRGFWRTGAGEVEAVLRRFDQVPWWTRPIARFFAQNEIRALERLGDAGVGPVLLARGDGFLVRSWVDALPLHVAQPKDNVVFFRAAKKLLARMRHAGVAHNDLAKQQNWLCTETGEPRVTDFQLAAVSRRRGRLFRVAAREDLRHLLKHKRKYCPQSLTASERRLLEQKSVPTRIWMATVKPVYNFVTRRLMGYMDREGAGIDATLDAPRIAAGLCGHPAIAAAAVLPYPTPRGTRLYAFIEHKLQISEGEIRAYLRGNDLPAPSLVQIVERLPRDAGGAVRDDVLRLVAQNQIDLIDKLALDADGRRIAMAVAEGRLNRTDRRLRETRSAS
jgi:predicted Ser/Thr protein kinase